MGIANSSRLRMFHRQMYIDLVHAYLEDYGTQRQLARALGVQDVHISNLLEPFRQFREGRREDAYWGDSVGILQVEVGEALKFLKTPSRLRAQQIADSLCSDRERRAVLLDHMRLAAERSPTFAASMLNPVDREELAEDIRAIGKLHSVALSGIRPEDTRIAYSQVWDSAGRAISRVDPRLFPIEYAQILMFLHDAASVLGRHDLALQDARQALLVLSGSCADAGESRDYVERFRINALLAEVVTLNNMGLRDGALVVLERAKEAPWYTMETEHWKRSFLEESLKSMIATPRSAIRDAEQAAEEACDLAGRRTQQWKGTQSKLLDVYVARGSIRKADHLADELARSELDSLSPLYGVRVLRSLARYYKARTDSGSVLNSLVKAAAIAASANLTHQSEEIRRQVERLAA
ncbi:hypothetical protein ACWGKW_40790 [Streptomyces sp. NPDC054766]